MDLTGISAPDAEEAAGIVAAALRAIEPPDPAWEARAWERLDSLTKPPRSLGRLEELAARIATLQRDVRPHVASTVIVLMAGDHGVTAQGVSPYPSEVTGQMVRNFASGGAAICQLARHASAELVLVDMGVASDVSDVPGVVSARIAAGTRDMSEGPAMTERDTTRSLAVGIRIANALVDAGTDVVGTGEMGIGNSTAAAALASAFTGVEPESVVGPGTGLDTEGLVRKAEVVRRALEANAAEDLDPAGVLAALGGYEIAGLAGLVIGCAARGVPVVADGFISGAAALAAIRIAPQAAPYVIASHRSAEPGHRVVLDALGTEPVLDLSMRLGEGTGAALAISLLGAACEVMSGMATFGEAGVSEREA